jgi:beta-glucosidase/6-phospho-beta-glucosidase/beta-galactosidase
MTISKSAFAFYFSALLLCALYQPTLSKDLLKSFVWGVSQTAYQTEGAWNADGKGLSIWDTFTQNQGMIYNNQNAQVGTDFYHRYKEDIQIMKKLGVKNFQMSISWSRILPQGTLDSVNQKGVEFYNNVFAALKEAGIEPWVTLFHWDLPAALNDRTSNGGWLNKDIVRKFNDYAEFCFKNFGDKVKYWLTFNEILEFAWAGYGDGSLAPGRCSPDVDPNCLRVGGGGDSSTEPYIVVHNALLAHAYAVKTYKLKYQSTQKGKIGLSADTDFALPYNFRNPRDVQAADTYMAFNYGWIVDPLVFGRYPEIMRKLVTGNRLPEFTQVESQLIKGSYDFLGIDQYSSVFVKYNGDIGNNWQEDSRVTEMDTDVFGNAIGAKTGTEWQAVHPIGMRGLLQWISKRYNNPALYIFENGVSVPGEASLPAQKARFDDFRVNFHRDYIDNMLAAKFFDGINVKGYFAFSLTDNFEWTDGYNVKFGLVHVDYSKNLTRTIKTSGYYYSEIMNSTLEFDSEKDQLVSFNKANHHDIRNFVSTFDGAQ